MELKLWFAIIVSKCTAILSRLAGYKGTTISGTVALRIYPRILEHLGKFNSVIFVTGTNGKTTTANLIADMMRKSGRIVVHNREGANMLTGITACLLKSADWRGRFSADCAILEVDEGSLPAVTEQLVPTKIIILNFFRDQLDRYGEIDVLMKRMKEAIQPLDTQLILNTDDPLVMQFDRLNKSSIYFGLDHQAVSFGQYAASESVFCPVCSREMGYSTRHFGQLGDYACSCGFKRKPPTYNVEHALSEPALTFQMNGTKYYTELKGNFNIYNAAAAVASAIDAGVSHKQIQEVFSAYNPRNGRMETFYHRGLPYILNLNKNPSGTNVMIHELLSNPNKKQLLLILNDFVADGEDISWIWDVDFEVLNHSEIEKFICSGSRSSELALRLKYASIAENKIKDISNIQQAVDYALDHPMQTYILPTYTGLEKVKHVLKRSAQPS